MTDSGITDSDNSTRGLDPADLTETSDKASRRGSVESEGYYTSLARDMAAEPLRYR